MVVRDTRAAKRVLKRLTTVESPICGALRCTRGSIHILNRFYVQFSIEGLMPSIKALSGKKAPWPVLLRKTLHPSHPYS